MSDIRILQNKTKEIIPSKDVLNKFFFISKFKKITFLNCFLNSFIYKIIKTFSTEEAKSQNSLFFSKLI
jgi:hypothetical protein